MHAYAWAWVIIVAVVPLGLFALHRLTRGIRMPRTKRLLGALIAVWLLLPAPVPGYPDHYAPAFLVLGFEWLFQNPGHPQTAALILAAGTVLTLALALLLGVLLRRKAAPTTAE